LAKFTLTPLGFFFLEEPPTEALPIPHFRTVGNGTSRAPSAALLETIYTMQRRQAWMRDLLVEQGKEPLLFVKSAQLHEPPPLLAERIHATLGLNQTWARDCRTWTDALRLLHRTMDRKGVLVVVNGILGNNTHRKLDPAEFRGFVLSDEYAPLVFVNGADAKAAQMFTLAHELAHLFFGRSAAFDLRQMLPASAPIEQACNRVAAEFLVPEQELRRLWPLVRKDPEPFQCFARTFKVSALVAARRALDVALVSRADFLTFYRSYLSDERRKMARQPPGGDFYLSQDLRVGRRFACTLVQALKEGKLLYSEAYRLTGLHGGTFERYAASLGLGGP
jgi:Zn-dependent peptidase ImmA (M78 family)